MSDSLLPPSPVLPSGLSLGWANPDEQPDDGRIWLRWPAQEICTLRILSESPLHYSGHWFPASRSYRLCSYPACQFCASGDLGGGRTRRMASERRLRYVIVVETALSAEAPPGVPHPQRIWEFGEAVARQIQQLTGYQREGTVETRTAALQGLSLTLCREGGRESGAVRVSAAPGIAWPSALAPPLDAGAHLAASWRRAALRDGKGQPRLPVGF